MEESQPSQKQFDNSSPQEGPFIPVNLESLITKLDEKGIDYSQWANDPNRGPSRLFSEVSMGKNELIETAESLLRLSRVFRAEVFTHIDDQKFKLVLLKKISNSSGEEVLIEGDEQQYVVSKGLKPKQTPGMIMQEVIHEDLGTQAEITESKQTGVVTEKRPASPESKIPWIDSQYEFHSYEITVSVPDDSINKPIVSKGQAWTTVRQWIPA